MFLSLFYMPFLFLFMWVECDSSSAVSSQPTRSLLRGLDHLLRLARCSRQGLSASSTGSLGGWRKEIPIPDKISVSIRTNISPVNLDTHEPMASNACLELTKHARRCKRIFLHCHVSMVCISVCGGLCVDDLSSQGLTSSFRHERGQEKSPATPQDHHHHHSITILLQRWKKRSLL